MNEQALTNLMTLIKPLDEQAIEAAEQHLNSLTKPPGSLGKLEDIARQIAGITGEKPLIYRSVRS